MRTIAQISRYIMAAQETIKYVDKVMDIGTTNKFIPNLWGFPARMACVWKQTELIQKDIREQMPLLRREPADKQRGAIARTEVEAAATWGKHFGCGNCGVQSAMAFVRLRDFWKVLPLDWMQLKYGDHAFVVIGRDSRITASSPSQWNDDVVLCDPWKGVAGRMKDQSSLCRKELDLMYRLESR